MWNTPPRNTVNNKHVADDADRPGGDPASHAQQCAGQTEHVADDLAPQDAGGPMSSLAFSNRTSRSEKSMSLLHSSGRTNTRGGGDVAHAAQRGLRDDEALACSSHPDFHRRSWSFTTSTARWLRSGRGLSPPVRTCTDPGTRAS